ncbi:CBS domain-containing protein CBSX5 [Spinacia oleracea]|uniref:CBS domain-containing protein CBSX5 n=1 Tax=Spinacia oleracea TaxID=3562 RepID=A0A9R0IYX7_SPIOL|nr:CBS domain-containing protein CBSX5-like [Spinacia oleracea]
MAISLLTHVVSDLCLGKPALKSLSLSSNTTIADALSAIKASEDNFISIWCCDHQNKISTTNPRKLGGDDLNYNHNYNYNVNYDYGSSCKCVGKICMVDIICFLCKEENLESPTSALLSPVSAILAHDSGFIKHVDPSTSLLEAIDLILEGAQNLVVPIQNTASSYCRRKQQKVKGPTIHNGREYCWLTQEDVIQFILSRIGLFTPIPGMSVEELGIIQTNILAVDYHAPAVSALEAISQSLVEQSSVGVVDEDGVLVGEISPFTLSSCDETVAAALMTLSSGDLMSYIDWGGPPEDIVSVMKEGLKEKKLEGLLELLGDEYSSLSLSLSSSYSSSSSSSSDDESVSSTTSSTTSSRLTRYNRSWSYSARIVRKAEAIVCHPKSSLVAVMIQAISHRVNYVWVMEDDCTLAGIVTFRDMLEVFREYLASMVEEWGA